MGLLRAIVSFITPLMGVLDRLIPGRTPSPTVLPEVDHIPIAPSTDDEIEDAVLSLSSTPWVNLSRSAKADLLKRSMKLFQQNVKQFSKDAIVYKGSYDSGCGDEILQMFNIPLILAAYERILRYGRPQAPIRTSKRGDRVICDVWPRGLDNMLFSGTYGEVWMKPGHDATQGGKLQDCENKGTAPGLCCVLAAGNYMNLSVIDALHQIVALNNVCVLKVNPVNDWSGAALTKIFGPIIEAGALRIVYGGVEVAQKLIQDDRVTALHMTGSSATYNSIVWGPGGPGSGPQLVTKPFTAELGCVTPIIIVPSKKKWSKAELEYHAFMAICSACLNAGHNCMSTEIILTAKGWSQRDQFVAAIRSAFDSLAQKYPWYSGSQARLDAFRERFPSATEHGIGLCTLKRCTHPYLFASGISPDAAQTDKETWGPAVQEVALDVHRTADGSVDVAAFLEAATDFCNARCFGTLSCGLVVHPQTQRKHRVAVERALEDLRYGFIGVNMNPVVGAAIPELPWGAWASAGTAEDIGSGNALVESSLFDHAEKGVVWARWMMAPKSPLTPGHTNLEALMTRFIAYFGSRGPLSLAAVIFAAMRSQ